MFSQKDLFSYSIFKHHFLEMPTFKTVKVALYPVLSFVKNNFEVVVLDTFDVSFYSALSQIHCINYSLNTVAGKRSNIINTM